jgi:putative ABC transport system permease protein
MFKNYFKTAIRNLLKNKGFTAINLMGLALGIATCLLILLYVFDELSYDRYNKKAASIYRINSEIKFGGAENVFAVAAAPVAKAMLTDFPEIEQVVRFRDQGGMRVKKDGRNIQEDKVIFADSTLFAVFTLPMIEGNPATALREPHSVVITERTAKKYFNSVDVVGQVLTVNSNEPLKITGVINNMPSQSHFNFDFFVSMSTLPESQQEVWLSMNFNTYIVLKPGADPKRLEAKFPEFMRKHAGPQLQEVVHASFDAFEQSGNYLRLRLIPMMDIHLHSNLQPELGTNGNIQYVYIFSAVALFILLIACINFMNLSTARSSNRAREVGVRKVLGSPRSYLIAQFLTESILLTLAGAIIAVFVAWALLPFFNDLAGKQLDVSYGLLRWLLPAILVCVLIIGCLAGSYPAFFLSAFKPIDVLKGKVARGFKGGGLRSFLVVFQFAISIFLIAGTLVVYNQLKYIQSRDLGYDRNHVLIVQNVGTLGDKAKVFKQEVKKISGVDNATMTGGLPTADYGNTTSFFKDRFIDQKRAIIARQWGVDEDYLNTLGIKLIAGRNFSPQMLTDSSAALINEAAVKKLGYANPLNQILYEPGNNELTKLKELHIIGVIKDFNFRSLRENVTPMVFTHDEDRGALSVRIHAGSNIPAVMEQVKNKWKEASPNEEFGYSFMEQDFDALYRAEQRMGKIFVSFTTLAIIIACLGLFGLAAFAAEQRTKEVGIRKVLGANMSTIVRMLSKDFIRLVLIAIVIATPLAWMVMRKWLQGFAYRQEIQWWILALAGLGAVLIAFVTISFQSIKSAMTNPVDSLKSE